MSKSERSSTFVPGITFWSNRHFPANDGPDQETLTVTRATETGTAGVRKRSYEIDLSSPRNNSELPGLLQRLDKYPLLTENGLKRTVRQFNTKMGSTQKRINGGVGHMNPNTGEIEIEY